MSTLVECRHCPVCGEDKPASVFGKDRSKSSGYASRCKRCDTTRSKRYYAAHREHKLAVARSKVVVIPGRVCPTCGKTYTPHRKDQRHCSMACHDHRGAIVIVDCAYCGKPTEKAVKALARYPITYCDRACSNTARFKKGTALIGPVRRREVIVGPAQPCATQPLARAWVAGQCAECSRPFVAQRLRGTQSYCTTECARRSIRRRGKQMRSKRIHEAAQRERVSLTKVAMRDAWCCHICKRKVTRSTWSLDHLVPLSRGGDHTYANVALAHHRCNTIRGNTGPAQLRLAA